MKTIQLPISLLKGHVPSQCRLAHAIVHGVPAPGSSPPECGPHQIAPTGVVLGASSHLTSSFSVGRITPDMLKSLKHGTLIFFGLIPPLMANPSSAVTFIGHQLSLSSVKHTTTSKSTSPMTSPTNASVIARMEDCLRTTSPPGTFSDVDVLDPGFKPECLKTILLLLSVSSASGR